MTKIQWTNQTWNPIIGCTKVSPGCNECYAEKMAKRLSRIASTNYYKKVLGHDFTNFGDNGEFDPIPRGWNGKTHLVNSALQKPSKRKTPTMYFVCSMGDLFHESVPFSWIMDVMDVIEDNPQHTFQILTKRPERMLKYFGSNEQYKKSDYKIIPNLWLGVTTENQEQANKRIPILLQIPAAIRFISVEPMLSAIDLTKLKRTEYPILKFDCLSDKWKFGAACFYADSEGKTLPRGKIDWVICGGESGKNARPLHPDWASSIQQQCENAKTPFFFKQWGKWQAGSNVVDHKYKGFHAYVFNDGTFVKDFSIAMHDKMNSISSNEWNSLKPNLMAKVGKAKSGNLIDGKEYSQFPK